MDDITVLENIAFVKQSTSEKLLQDETRLLTFTTAGRAERLEERWVLVSD